VRATSTNDRDLLNEIRAIEKLCNKYNRNIVELFRHGSLQNSLFYAIDMELCDVNLQTYIQTDFDPSQPNIEPVSIYKLEYLDRSQRITKWRGIVSIMLDVLYRLKFIHACDEVHRDLKPTNSALKPASALTLVLFSRGDCCWKIAISGFRRLAHLPA
jgi:serine/threonine protein kinase